MAKTRAFTCPNSTGLDYMVTAKQVANQRTTLFHGQPTPDRYFSNHRPGKRVPVKHVMKGGSSYFSFIGDGIGGHGDGESLNHLLFKEALLNVTKMTLSLSFSTNGKSKANHQIPITITHIEPEKLLVTHTGNRYVDIYLEFKAAHWLDIKWEGKLYLEINNTHAVDAAKQLELRELDIPLVEVRIPEFFDYKIPEEDTTDALEDAHRLRIKKTLEGPNSYLKGVVLNDPSSKKFLELLIKVKMKEIETLSQDVSRLTAEFSNSEHILEKTQASLAATTSQLAEATKQHDTHADSLSDTERELAKVIKSHSELQSHQHALIIERRWLIAGFCIMTALCLGVTWLYSTQPPS